MKRSTLCSMLAFMAIMFAVAAATPASAQCPLKCTYHVSISCDISLSCFQLNLMTGWHCINDIEVVTLPIDKCGEYDFQKAGPCEPVPCDLTWTSIDGGKTIAVPNGPPVAYTCADGTQICLTLILEPNGCSVIKIGPGPC